MPCLPRMRLAVQSAAPPQAVGSTTVHGWQQSATPLQAIGSTTASSRQHHRKQSATPPCALPQEDRLCRAVPRCSDARLRALAPARRIRPLRDAGRSLRASELYHIISYDIVVYRIISCKIYHSMLYDVMSHCLMIHMISCWLSLATRFAPS